MVLLFTGSLISLSPDSQTPEYGSRRENGLHHPRDLLPPLFLLHNPGIPPRAGDSAVLQRDIFLLYLGMSLIL